MASVPQKTFNNLTQRILSVSLPLLLFLTGIIYVKLYLKLAAVVLYAGYLLYNRYSFPVKAGRPLLFYLLIIPAGLLASLLNDPPADPGYWRGCAIGTMKWLVAAAAFYLLTITVKHTERTRIVSTLKAFFLLNTLVSFFDLAMAMIKTQSWMPYWLYDTYGYGISTGDLIYGISRDSSITNAALNLAGILFFMFRKELGWVMLCLLTAALCTSNFSMLLLFVCLATVIILIRDRKVKLYAGITALAAIIIYGFLSMQNVSYANKTINQELAGMSSGKKGGWSVPKPQLGATHNVQAENEDTEKQFHIPGTNMVITDLRRMHSYILASNPTRIDTGLARLAVREWYGASYDSSLLAASGMPGKLYALLQTGDYMTSGIRPFLLGAGMGNFASNLAVKMTGLGIYGNYPVNYLYVHHDFLVYQLYIWVYVYAHTSEFHSVTQLPGNVYSQLGGEYGLIGLCLFFFCYVLYFLRQNRFHMHALIMTGMLLGYFFVDYWFEMVSLTAIFELMMLSWATNNITKSKRS